MLFLRTHLFRELHSLDTIDDVRRDSPVEGRPKIEAEIHSMCLQCHSAFCHLDTQFSAVLRSVLYRHKIFTHKVYGLCLLVRDLDILFILLIM